MIGSAYIYYNSCVRRSLSHRVCAQTSVRAREAFCPYHPQNIPLWCSLFCAAVAEIYVGIHTFPFVLVHCIAVSKRRRHTLVCIPVEAYMDFTYIDLRMAPTSAPISVGPIIFNSKHGNKINSRHRSYISTRHGRIQKSFVVNVTTL